MEFIKQTNRIYATNEEGMVVAEITYSETGEGVCTIEHVEVDEALRGQGIAGKLVEAAVAEIKAQNKKVATNCPYAYTIFYFTNAGISVTSSAGISINQELYEVYYPARFETPHMDYGH